MPDSKLNVLMVDDVDANLVALDAVLSDLDCQLVRARSGNEALRQLLKRDFAVMLLDIQMPEMDGFEVAKYARENPKTQHVPIIFLTAMHQTEDGLLRGYGSGAVDYLTKPIMPHVLRAKVRVFLELHSGRQRLQEEIAAHRKTLAALEQANTALRHFTNAASHDLKAPLRAMRGFLGAMAEECGQLDEKTRHYLDRSRNASQRMESLLNALLVYAGLQRPVSYTDVDCARIFEQVRVDLAERITAAGATVEAESLPHVTGDPDRVYQLMLNLVSNGLKFRRSGEAHHVRVSAQVHAGETTFCVADNGIGIDPKDREIIFNPFQRVYSAREYEGTGLGLTICRQIVEQHGGRMWLESELGQGTSFWFTVPNRRAGSD
jgi:two-component system, sensor histidine kinase and response regulator